MDTMFYLTGLVIPVIPMKMNLNATAYIFFILDNYSVGKHSEQIKHVVFLYKVASPTTGLACITQENISAFTTPFSCKHIPVLSEIEVTHRIC